MSLKNLIKAALAPTDLYATYLLFRDLGSTRIEALKNAVACVVNYHFALTGQA